MSATTSEAPQHEYVAAVFQLAATECYMSLILNCCSSYPCTAGLRRISCVGTTIATKPMQLHLAIPNPIMLTRNSYTDRGSLFYILLVYLCCYSLLFVFF